MSIPQANRTLVMGIVNVTPDSFSDGGEFFTPEAALRHARELVAEGADIIDVGGESTRPGAARPDASEELRRVVPVVEALAADGITVSVDTMRADVARACAGVGAAIINDVAGGLADERMLPTVAELGIPYITMHWAPQDGELMASGSLPYDDFVAGVLAELQQRIDAALAAGVAPENLIVDPGFGFAKSPQQQWELLREIDRVVELGYRCLVGVSRKRFLGTLLSDGRTDRPPKDRDAATAALTTYFADHDVWAVRTHAVRLNRDAVRVVARLHGEE